MILKLLKKYGYEVKLSKTQLYQNIAQSKDLLNKEGFQYDMKSIDDLLKVEVVLNGLKTKKRIEEAYHLFYAHNYDVFEYINYDEKRMMFNRDVETFINECPSFKNKDGLRIYIPYLEPFINQRYLDDYQLMTLKQHQSYLKNYPRDIQKPYELYGYLPFVSHFSSLQAIGQDENSYYFYHQELKKVLIFHAENFLYEDEICFVDKHNDLTPTLDDIKDMMRIYLNQDDQHILLETLFERGFIQEKTYKKILKKLK